jgi:hypothetical protein
MKMMRVLTLNDVFEILRQRCRNDQADTIPKSGESMAGNYVGVIGCFYNQWLNRTK